MLLFGVTRWTTKPFTEISTHEEDRFGWKPMTFSSTECMLFVEDMSEENDEVRKHSEL